LLEQTVQDLQGCDEEYKVAIGELTLHMKVSKAHGNHLETTLNLFLQQRFDFRENHSSPRNNDTFLTWIDHSLSHSPHIACIPNLPVTVFNRTSVTNTCKKHYTYLKRRYKESFDNHTAPLISVKRKVEDLDAPEPGLFGALAAEGIPGPSGAYGAVPGGGDFSNLALGHLGTWRTEHIACIDTLERGFCLRANKR
ncbi:hypothetical protein FRC06_009973, partial [Ceratobasidium sp. 370]